MNLNTYKIILVTLALQLTLVATALSQKSYFFENEYSVVALAEEDEVIGGIAYPSGVEEANGLAIDRINKVIYLSSEKKSDTSINGIFKINLTSGTSQNLVLDFGGEEGIGVAFSEVNEKLYWIQTSPPSAIKRMDTDGTNVETLIESASFGDFYGNIHINNITGDIYWTERNTNPQIWKADMNGENKVLLIEHEDSDARYYDVATTAENIFWIDQGDFDYNTNPKIMKANLDGTGIEVMRSYPAGESYLDYIEVNPITERVYWYYGGVFGTRIESIKFNSVGYEVAIPDNVFSFGTIDFDYEPIVINATEELALSDFELFPNPTEGEAFIQVNQKLPEEAFIVVYNNAGLEVFRKPLDNKESISSISFNLDNGLYHLAVFGGSNLIHSQTLMVQH